MNLSNNDLWSISGENKKLVFSDSRVPSSGKDLQLAFSGFNETKVSSIDLSKNKLFILQDTELKQVFSNLPPNITVVNLSNNELGRKSTQELITIISAFPETVVSINLARNNLFTDKTRQERDALIKALAPYNTHGRLNLEENGLTLARTFFALINLTQQRDIPLGITNKIASYLNYPNSHFFTKEMLKSHEQKVKDTNTSENNTSQP
ncbi:MAG: hypothetical protein QM652_09875 [Legionella sp.]|uniref:hypothetical protein n=1 Tax=Legionella sp. TaxID=459 RepID=UPI0039E636DB